MIKPAEPVVLLTSEKRVAASTVPVTRSKKSTVHFMVASNLETDRQLELLDTNGRKRPSVITATHIVIDIAATNFARTSTSASAGRLASRGASIHLNHSAFKPPTTIASNFNWNAQLGQ